MHWRLTAIIFCFAIQTAFAQKDTYPDFFQQKINYLNRKVVQANIGSEKIVALGELANYYYLYKLEKEGDSILQMQLTEAELSQNKNLILAALFDNAIMNITPWTPTIVFDRTLHLIQMGLNYAREINRKDYVALAFIRKANVLRKRGQYDEAIGEATKAFSALENVKADSIRVVLNLELGDLYIEKKEAVQAFQNYSNAYEIAYTIKNIPLQSQCFHRFFNLHQYTLNNTEVAKEYLRKSLELNKDNNYVEGLLADYNDFARITDNRQFIDSLLMLTEHLENKDFSLAENYRLIGKNKMLVYHMVVTANSQVAMDYFTSNADLKFYTTNAGMPIYYATLGNIYFYSKKFDSALYYYKQGEPEVMQSFEPILKAGIYKSIAKCYQSLNQLQPAIEYYQKSLNFNSGDIDVLSNLSKLYAQVSDFEKAYAFNAQYNVYRDSLQKLNSQRELDMLEVDRENVQRQKELEELAAQKIKLHNLQYTGISMATAFLFIMLLVTGMFPVSKTAIRMLNFVSFICLFEFIILLIDNWLHDITHGEPLKIWLAKIFVIALLLPLHHFLEHVAVKFLSSQKLIKFRQRLSLKKILHPSKKSVEKLEENLEESTLV